MDDDVVVVIGCGMQRYREYLLASAAKRHTLWLFNATEPTWQSEYIAGATVLPDILDRDVVLAAAKELAGKRTVVGVLSWDETLVVAVAHVAAALGLPGAGIDGIEGCRDKQRNRRVLTDAGLGQPAYRWTTTEDDAVAAAEAIGYPVVVKPRGMGASIGVVLAEDAGGVRGAFHTAEDSSYDGARAYHGGALVEEYLDGPEISVDAAVLDGEYLPMFIARKDVGMYPYFEELGHTVAADDPLFDDPELSHVLRTAHTAIGYGFGITHTEVKLTKRGPIIVEINGRLGGDLIPFLGMHATGIDPGVAVVDVALGNKPDLVKKFDRVVGIRFGYPPQDCVVRSISVPEPSAEESILTAAAIVDPGAELRLPPGGYISRHAYVICSGSDARECTRNLDRAIDSVRLDWQPLAKKSAK
ncbi:MAG: ATP-grasp domain-containing protein [Sciscionella sp.]|nr:ATP-grasp domain-containing protein [Sciscionella sp.]